MLLINDILNCILVQWLPAWLTSDRGLLLSCQKTNRFKSNAFVGNSHLLFIPGPLKIILVDFTIRSHLLLGLQSNAAGQCIMDNTIYASVLLFTHSTLQPKNGKTTQFADAQKLQQPQSVCINLNSFTHHSLYVTIAVDDASQYSGTGRPWVPPTIELPEAVCSAIFSLCTWECILLHWHVIQGLLLIVVVGTESKGVIPFWATNTPNPG